MNPNCDNWRDQLNKLKVDLSEYQSAYAECESSNDFMPLKPKKDDLKGKIFGLREGIPEARREKELQILTQRFYENIERHSNILMDIRLNPGLSHTAEEARDIIWKKIEERLRKNPKLIDTLIKMEETGGEPDAIWYFADKDHFIFVDCSKESPEGRRNLCYDKEGQEAAEKKGEKPQGNAVDMTKEMGIELLDNNIYRSLITLGEFDKNTFNWLSTFPGLRVQGLASIGHTTKIKSPGRGMIVKYTSIVKTQVFADF